VFVVLQISRRCAAGKSLLSARIRAFAPLSAEVHVVEVDFEGGSDAAHRSEARPGW
jgi:hypothetical protein